MPVKSEREYRNLQNFEIRKAEDDENKMIVRGQFTTYDSPYRLYGFEDEDLEYEMWEVIDSHAFDGCDTSDVIMQYDHQGRVFARTSNETLALDFSIPEMEAELGGTTLGRQLYEEIGGGYTTKMSFGFVVGNEIRNRVKEEREGMKPLVKVTRTITSIKKLFDVSAVSLPANDQTSISVRSVCDGEIAKAHEEFMEQRRLEIAKAKAEAMAQSLLLTKED